MIYLVTRQLELFNTQEYQKMSIEDAVKIVSSWDIIQFDTETSGRNCHLCDILCAQFGNDAADTQIVVDTTCYSITLFKDVLESKLIVGQNLKFDIQFLFNFGIIPRKIWDTMIAEQVLFLGYNTKYFHVSLKAIADRRLGINIDKTVRGEIIWRGLDPRVVIYAAGDVLYLEQIMNQQIEEAKKKGNLAAIKLENNFVPVCAYLEWCGIKLDINKWRSYVIKPNLDTMNSKLKELNDWVVKDYYDNIDKVKNVVLEENVFGKLDIYDVPKDAIIIGKEEKHETDSGYIITAKCKMPNPVAKYVSRNLQGDLFTGYDTSYKCSLNWGSSKQLIPYFKYLGFDLSDVDKKTGEKKESVSEKVLSKQKGVCDEFLKVYLAYKEAEKVCSTYGENYIDAINPKTGRIHTKFKQIGADTSRMSCGGGSKDTDSDLAAYKGIPANRCKMVQLQNLPHDKVTRSCFISEPNNLLVAADFSALEARLGADIYQEEKMLHEFLYGSGDTHSVYAKIVFKDDLADVDVKDIRDVRPDLRTKVKPVEFAIQFGGGADAVSKSLCISKPEAQKLVDNCLAGMDGLRKYKQWSSNYVCTTGQIVICKYTGLKTFWEDFKKWKAVEETPDDIREHTFSKEELDEHNLAGGKWKRKALNSVTQGTGAEIIKLAGILIFRWVVNNNLFGIVKFCNVIHDEWVIEFPKDHQEVPNIVKECMEKAAATLCKSLPIPSVPEVGDHWIH